MSLWAPEMESTAAMAQTFVGTLTYMSPERIAGEVCVLMAPTVPTSVPIPVPGQTFAVSPALHLRAPQPYNANSDVWSFGMSILTCALGKFPLDASGTCNLLPRTLGSLLPPWGVSASCLLPQRDVRTPGGYWTLLNRLRDGEPPGLPETFSPVFRDFIRLCLDKVCGVAGVVLGLAAVWFCTNTLTPHVLARCPMGFVLNLQDPASRPSASELLKVWPSLTWCWTG